MKFKTTQREIKQSYPYQLSVGNCNLQMLLSYEEPVSYTTRREGWAADIYVFGDVAIVTGYAPFGNVKVPYDICQKYEAKWHEVSEELEGSLATIWNTTWAEKREKYRELIDELIDEVLEGKPDYVRRRSQPIESEVASSS